MAASSSWWTDSEQWDLHYDADGTGWQGRSIPNSSIGGSELGTPSSSNGPCRTSMTKGGAVIGCGAPPPASRMRFRAHRRATAAAAAAIAAAVDGFFSEEDDDDNEQVPTDTQIALALRAVYTRHRHDLTLTRWTLMQKIVTELGGADLWTRMSVLEKIIARMKLEEAKPEAARGCHADDEPTAIGFDDGARDHFAVGFATELGVPHDGMRVTGAHAGSVIVEMNVIVEGGAEAAASFTSSLTDSAKPLVDELRFGPCAVSGVRVEEPAAAPAVAARVEAPAEPAPPPAPAMADNSPSASHRRRAPRR